MGAVIADGVASLAGLGLTFAAYKNGYQAQTLAMRINMISKRSIRRKLWSYFDYMGEQAGSDRFSVGSSLSQLANFLCVDRASMMRELKSMSGEGLIAREGREIQILKRQ